MTVYKSFRVLAVALAAVGMLIPAPALAVATAFNSQNTPVVTDIGLQKDNLLFGQLLDASGTPQENVEVKLIQQEKAVSTIKTNESGYFVFSKVPVGTYKIAAGQTTGVYRLWAPETAPSSAQPGAMMVVGQGPVRAQQGPISYWLSKPWIIACNGMTAFINWIRGWSHNEQIQSEETTAISNNN
jgi:Carboxypeptidase regulatory-like domain